MSENGITHFCLGNGALKCDGCRQEQNWQMLNQMPDALRKSIQAQAHRLCFTGRLDLRPHPCCPAESFALLPFLVGHPDRTGLHQLARLRQGLAHLDASCTAALTFHSGTSNKLHLRQCAVRLSLMSSTLFPRACSRRTAGISTANAIRSSPESRQTRRLPAPCRLGLRNAKNTSSSRHALRRLWKAGHRQAAGTGL